MRKLTEQGRTLRLFLPYDILICGILQKVLVQLERRQLLCTCRHTQLCGFHNNRPAHEAEIADQADNKPAHEAEVADQAKQNSDAEA